MAKAWNKGAMADVVEAIKRQKTHGLGDAWRALEKFLPEAEAGAAAGAAAGAGTKGGMLKKLLGMSGTKMVGGGIAALLLLPILTELLDIFSIGPKSREARAQKRLQTNQLLAQALLMGEEKKKLAIDRQERADIRNLERSQRAADRASQRDLARLFATKGGLQSAAELATMIQQVAGVAGSLPPVPGPGDQSQALMQQLGYAMR